MDEIQKNLLKEVSDLHSIPEGAFNIRIDGAVALKNTTANIDIVSKKDKNGIDIYIKENTKNESVHIPVKYVGLGEGIDDLEAFDIEKYIYGLFKDL